MEREAVDARLREAIVGGPETVRAKLAALVERVGIDEVLVVTDTYETVDRLRTYEVAMEAARTLDEVFAIAS